MQGAMYRIFSSTSTFPIETTLPPDEQRRADMRTSKDKHTQKGEIRQERNSPKDSLWQRRRLPQSSFAIFFYLLPIDAIVLYPRLTFSLCVFKQLLQSLQPHVVDDATIVSTLSRILAEKIHDCCLQSWNKRFDQSRRAHHIIRSDAELPGIPSILSMSNTSGCDAQIDITIKNARATRE